MKKIGILFVLVLFSTISQAQKKNIVSSWNYLKYDEIDKAKLAIDEASKNEETAGMAKTWYYKGMIYEKMHKHKNIAFAVLDSTPLVSAYNYYEKSLQIDSKSEYAVDINLRKYNLYSMIFNQGIEEFKGERFRQAMLLFETAMVIQPNDTLSVLNAATSAERANNKEKAKTYYQKVIDLKYKDANIYTLLAELYKSEKDTARALEVLRAGRKEFPVNQAMIITELNIYLLQGKNKEALEMFTTAIANEPTNPSMYYNYGLVNEKTGDLVKAEEAYKKAIELKPDFFDAIYSIGAMHFNAAAEIGNKANNIKPDKVKEYNEAKAKADEVFKKALPFLEKAYELNPKDQSTLFSLKQLYVRLGETEKYKKIKAELEQLK